MLAEVSAKNSKKTLDKPPLICGIMIKMVKLSRLPWGGLFYFVGCFPAGCTFSPGVPNGLGDSSESTHIWINSR